MKKLLILSVLAIFALSGVSIEDADAGRFGGGMSFGKSRMFKQPTQQRAAPKKATPATAQKGSARTGMMGMIGGLALGGLLGAMFFGGAFEGINFFDILIFGILAYILFKMMAGRARTSVYASGQPQPQQGFAGFGGTEPASPIQGQAVTPDIDHDFFITAAKDIFVRMQAAWDKKDMEEIRGFCTPEVASRIEAEMASLGETTNKTEVATLNAEIMDSWVESNLEWVAVHFTAMIKEEEDGIEIAAHEVQEHWIFQHDPSGDDPTWYLAGIQQS